MTQQACQPRYDLWFRGFRSPSTPPSVATPARLCARSCARAACRLPNAQSPRRPISTRCAVWRAPTACPTSPLASSANPATRPRSWPICSTPLATPSNRSCRGAAPSCARFRSRGAATAAAKSGWHSVLIARQNFRVLTPSLAPTSATRARCSANTPTSTTPGH
jgi:hypothetical protein